MRLALALLSAASSVQAQAQAPAHAQAAPPFQPSPALAKIPINLRFGSGGAPNAQGMTFPGATTPFGNVRLSPDALFGAGPKEIMNRFAMGTAGYSHDFDRIQGFSHTRLSGTGVREGGLFRVRPVTRDIDFEKRKGLLPLHHEQENFEPGYYSIRFHDDAIFAELTASTHCGFHRYTALDPEKKLRLLIDANSSIAPTKPRSESQVTWNGDHGVLTGQTLLQGQFSARYGGLPAFFYAEVSGHSRSDEDSRLWQGSQWLRPGSMRAQGPSSGAGITAREHDQPIELKLCISYVSAENARQNFEAEARGMAFDSAREKAASRWAATLGRARVAGSDPSLERIFNSSLYFASVMPTHFSDSNGEYVGFDGGIRKAQGFTYRTDLSLWDSFRTVHPLYSLIFPEIQRDSALSLLDMGRSAGVLPRWPSGLADSGSMFGSPANFVLAETWLKGIQDFNAQEALELMVKGATEEHPNLPSRKAVCFPQGYCPSDKTTGSVSLTLEYAWADHATANLARSLGHELLAQEFDQRSEAFFHLWNPENRYFVPKDSLGTFGKISPDLLSYFGFLGHGTHHFVEGSANQWRYSTPHRGKKLVELFGGGQAFSEELERFLKGASKRRSAIYPGGRYWHGNQHDLHAIYLFNEAGRPELTQKWARWALLNRYADRPDGLDGNDDGGTLSSWFVLSSLGLYPQAGSDRYWLGAPLFERATLDLGNGTTLNILAKNQARKNAFVREVRLNGHKLCQPEIRHEELKNATLEFTLSPTPVSGGGYGCEE